MTSATDRVITDVVHGIFGRFDYDESGTINSFDELKQLASGLLYTLKMKHAKVVTVPTKPSDVVVNEMLEAVRGQEFEWTPAECAAWACEQAASWKN